METPGKLIKYHQLARPENRASLTIAKLDLSVPEANPRLQVDIDGNGTVDLVVAPLSTQPPIANAGPNQTVRLGSLVQLNGSRSLDPDNGPAPLSYRWTQSSGPSSALSNADFVKPTFTPRTTGAYKFTLTVSDGAATSAPANVLITVPRLGDIDLDGDVDFMDLLKIVPALGKPASGPNDVRDINGDGRIDSRDIEALAKLCTRRFCADR